MNTSYPGSARRFRGSVRAVLAHVDLARAAVQDAVSRRVVLEAETERDEPAGERDGQGDPEHGVACPALPRSLRRGRRARPEQVGDDRLGEAELPLTAPVHELLRTGDRRYLGAVPLSKALDERGVGAGGEHERVRAAPLGPEAVGVQLDGALAFDDARHLTADRQHVAGGGAGRMPGVDPAVAALGGRRVALVAEA